MHEAITTIGSLGEAGILARILTDEGPQDQRVLIGPGDDAAVLTVPEGRIVATTDTLVEGKDVLLHTSTGDWLGHKAAVQNLADVAAMGARPIALLAALSAPSDTPVELLAAISRGLRERAAREGASLVGGDLGGADMLTLTITALGVLEAGREPVRRSGARPGDVLVVGSDQLGRSAAGLALVLSGRCSVTADGRETAVCWDGAPLTADGAVLGAGLDAPAAAVLRWHQAPDPDLGLGPRHGARLHALLDVSDGLVRDAERIASASGVHVDIDPSALEKDVRMLAPLAAALGEDARDWVYAGGEEHCLLGTCAADDVPEGFRVIGRIADGAGVTIGGAVPAARGWDHFG